MRIAVRLVPLLLAGWLGACATPGESLHRDGLALLSEGRIEEGLARLQDAARANPSSAKFRSDFLTKQEQAVNALLATADGERMAGHFSEAEVLYRQALNLQPATPRAQAGIALIERDRRHLAVLATVETLLKKGDLEGAQEKLRPVLLENPALTAARNLQRQIDEQRTRVAIAPPILKSKLTRPITLEFRDANLKMVFDALSRTSGINFVFDRDVRSDLKTTVFVRQVAVEDAIDLILLTNQLEKKVLGENSILIYPNTPPKLREYQDLVIKSFYLENADVKQTQNLLRTMLKTKDMFIDEKLNLLVMRDTPDAIRLAEKLVAAQDLAEPEVLLEVEVLEVLRTRLLELGVVWPTQSTLTLLPPAVSTSVVQGAFTVSDLRGINSDRLGFAPVPSATLNYRKEEGDTNTLASPRIRVRNREKARILIGDRVPVISSVVTPSTGTPVVTDTIQYLDVGLKLEVEPAAHLDDEVTIRVNLEVSTLGDQVTSRNGTVAFRVGTRNASTTLRLKDGETQALMGLIRDDEVRRAQRVPGLGDLPILGRLFSNQRRDGTKTEIVLSITPRLVRNVKRIDAQIAEYWSGTEATLRTEPITARAAAGTAETVSVAPAPGARTAAAAPAAPAAAAGPSLPLTLSWDGPAEAKQGQEIQIGLIAETDAPLTSSGIQARFDPAVLQFVKVEEGDFLRQNGAKTSFNQTVDPPSGRVFAGIARPAGEGAKGQGKLLVYTFKAVAPSGSTEIQLLNVAPVRADGGNVTVKAAGPFRLQVSP